MPFAGLCCAAALRERDHDAWLEKSDVPPGATDLNRRMRREAMTAMASIRFVAQNSMGQRSRRACRAKQAGGRRGVYAEGFIIVEREGEILG
jgi:hypothetical protein